MKTTKQVNSNPNKFRSDVETYIRQAFSIPNNPKRSESQNIVVAVSDYGNVYLKEMKHESDKHSTADIARILNSKR